MCIQRKVPHGLEALNEGVESVFDAPGSMTAGRLLNAGIQLVRQLVLKTEADLLKIKGFGRKALNEVKEELAERGLRLGMTEDDLLAIAQGRYEQV